MWGHVCGRVAIERQDFDRYFCGSDQAVAVPVEQLQTLGQPVPLDELRQRHPTFRAPQSHRYVAPDEVRQLLNGEYDHLVGERCTPEGT